MKERKIFEFMRLQALKEKAETLTDSFALQIELQRIKRITSELESRNKKNHHTLQQDLELAISLSDHLYAYYQRQKEIAAEIALSLKNTSYELDLKNQDFKKIENKLNFISKELKHQADLKNEVLEKDFLEEFNQMRIGLSVKKPA